MSGGGGGGGSHNDANFHVSANQWRTTLLKASIGSHVPRGVAEDVADGGIALLAIDCDPSAALLDALKTRSPDADPPCWPKSSNITDLGDVDILHHGPSVIDMVQSGNTVACTTEFPTLLLGLAQARRHTHGALVECQLDKGGWHDITSTIAAPTFTDAAAPAAVASRVKLRLAGLGEPQPIDLTQLPQPSRRSWQRLQDHANKILVPADATNRADAGAGLTDND